MNQLRRACAGLRGWITRDFDAVTNIIESQSPEVARVEEKIAESRRLADGDRKALEQ